MSEIIESIKNKYIVKATQETLPKAKGNVQAQINKLKAIDKFVRNNYIGPAELNRLESVVGALYNLIRNKSG